MRSLPCLIALTLLSVIDGSFAQVTAGSQYSGNMTRSGAGGGGGRTDQVEIKITKVEGATVQGTATRLVPGFCRGEVPVEGKLEGDKLTLRSVKGAPEVKQDCDLEWELKVDGKTLEGKSTGGTLLRLSSK